MHKTVLVILATLALSGAALAQQETPAVEVFGGYSYLHFSAAGDSGSVNGWNASANFNFNKWFGVKADLTGHYGSDLGDDGKLHSFTFGPQLTYRGLKHATPFFHAMAGAAKIDVLGFDDTALALVFGGGLDVKVHPRVALRLAQADWYITRFNDPITLGNNQNNFRFAAGIVLRLGER